MSGGLVHLLVLEMYLFMLYWSRLGCRMVGWRRTLGSLFCLISLVFSISLRVVGSSIEAFRDPLPHSPPFTVLEPEILSIKEFHKIVEGVLISRGSAVALIGNSSFVEVRNGQSGSLEGLQ